MNAAFASLVPSNLRAGRVGTDVDRPTVGFLGTGAGATKAALVSLVPSNLRWARADQTGIGGGVEGGSWRPR